VIAASRGVKAGFKNRREERSQRAQLAQRGGHEAKETFLEVLCIVGTFLARRHGALKGFKDELEGEGFLRGEIVEERARGDAGAAGEVARRGGLEALLPEEPPGSL